jgi:hypothetical protein
MPWRRLGAPDPSPGLNPAPSAGQVAPAQVSPALLAWAEALDATQLSETTVKSAERFLRDYRRMGTLNARREIAFRLRSKIEAEASPRPPVSVANMDVIATAIAVRRRQLGLG